MSTDPMVTIFCVTYNHEPYIADALEGFMMQKTDFPVECLVVDDCSTDGTLNVVRSYQEKYPGRIRVVMPPQNTKGKFSERIYAQLAGKYIAHCEGDDYWVDEYKLQEQVDYMEEHPTCACYCSNSFFLDQNNLEESRHAKGLVSPVEDMDYFDIQFLYENASNMGGSASRLCRNYHEGFPIWSERFDFGDSILILQAFKHGYVHYSGKARAVYRVNVPGSYNGRIRALTPVERASKWLHYWENQCEVLDFFNADTGYQWDELIKKEKRYIRDEHIAKQYKALHLLDEGGKKEWDGIVPIIDGVLDVADVGKGHRNLAIWGMGSVGNDLTDELTGYGQAYRSFDRKKEGLERPKELFAAEDRYFVIVTMMKGYEEAEKELQAQGYMEWRDYICLAKFTEIWLYYCI